MGDAALRIIGPDKLAWKITIRLTVCGVEDAGTLEQIAHFTPDMPGMETFHVERLKFVVTDRFNGVWPFLRPQACVDHPRLFLLATPPSMQGLGHLAFDRQGATEVAGAGSAQAGVGLVPVFQLPADDAFRIRLRHGPARRVPGPARGGYRGWSRALTAAAPIPVCTAGRLN